MLEHPSNQNQNHFISCTPPKTVLSCDGGLSPEELVDRALKTLQDAGVQLIEWRSLLYRRMGVPVVLKVNSFRLLLALR